MAVVIRIETRPVPWAAHGGSGAHSYNPRAPEREYFRLEIKRQYTSNEPLNVPVRTIYRFLFAPPASTPKRLRPRMLSGEIAHDVVPDVTNLLKFTEDCLKGIVFPDDRAVEYIEAGKAWGEKDVVYIRVEPTGTQGSSYTWERYGRKHREKS